MEGDSNRVERVDRAEGDVLDRINKINRITGEIIDPQIGINLHKSICGDECGFVGCNCGGQVSSYLSDKNLVNLVEKRFLIIGNMNAITYKEVFPLIKDNRL